MTRVPVREPPLSRLDLREELEWTLKHYATKDDFAELKLWLVGLLVVVLNVVGTVGAIVAALLPR